jgi:NADP-dependent 3-hydroxy acid dehydrogenase YdfG
MFMKTINYKTALIVGAGEGLSASLTRLFTREGIRVALAARHTDKLGALCKETGATAYACDATSLDDVTRLFAAIERDCGAPDVIVYNVSARLPGAFVDLIPADVEKAIAVPVDKPDSMLDPDAIAANYWNVLCQPRSAWTWEMEMRPWVEKF